MKRTILLIATLAVAVIDAGNSNYTGAVALDADFHYPIDRLGSSQDSSP